MDTLNIDIGKRIARLRKDRHITQEQLAEMLDISIKHCSAVERGVSSLSIEKYIALCEIFDTSLDYLIRGLSVNDHCNIPPTLLQLYQRSDEEERKLLKMYHEMYLNLRNHFKK